MYRYDEPLDSTHPNVGELVSVSTSIHIPYGKTKFHDSSLHDYGASIVEIVWCGERL